MKKALALVLAAVLIIGTLAGCGGQPAGSSAGQGEGQTKDLNIFTWDGYIPQDVLDGYTEQTGVKINISNFESNEEMLTKLEATGGGDYDIVIASDYIIDIARKKGGIMHELDTSKIANYNNIDAAFQGQFYDPDNQYTIPYAAGTPVIVYDPSLVDIDIQGYEDLWNPALADSIVAMDDGRNLIGMTLKSMGKSFNETDEAVLEQAKNKLMELKPNIRTLAVNQLQDVILSGEASVGYMFASQAAMAVEANPELKVVYPKEGMGFGIDNIIVPAKAPNLENAYSFINYILDPEVGAKISSQIYYLCPNKASAEFLPESFTSNAALFIPSEVLKNTEFIQDVGETTAVYDKIWTEFKQQ